MTDSGNHGGSSYEETDSLALFIGRSSKLPRDDISATQDTINQVAFYQHFDLSQQTYLVTM